MTQTLFPSPASDNSAADDEPPAGAAEGGGRPAAGAGVAADGAGLAGHAAVAHRRAGGHAHLTCHRGAHKTLTHRVYPFSNMYIFRKSIVKDIPKTTFFLMVEINILNMF